MTEMARREERGMVVAAVVGKNIFRPKDDKTRTDRRERLLSLDRPPEAAPDQAGR